MNSIAIKSKILARIAPLMFQTSPISASIIENAEVINITKEEFKYLIHSTFNVVQIGSMDIIGFFRECRIHDEPHKYILSLLEDYFNFVHRFDNALSVEKELMEYLSNPKRLKAFMNMGVKNNPDSGVAQFFNKGRVTAQLGIPNEHSELLDSELDNLLQFIWGEVYLYRLSGTKNKNRYQSFNANRQIASFLLAEHFNISTIIPKTKYVKLIIDEKYVKFGTMMQVAPGISPEVLDEKTRKNINPSTQKQLMEMNFLDLICRQTDHRPGHDGNYNVKLNSMGEVCGVCAFDNDSPTSFILDKKIDFMTSARTTSILTADGRLDRPYASYELSEAVLNSTDKQIEQLLDNCLSIIQIRYINKRIKALKTAILKSKQSKSTLFLKENEWTKITINDELQYCHQNKCITYLYSLYNLLY